MRNHLVAAFVVLAFAAALWPAWTHLAHADEPPTVHEVASELMCQCGCGLTVAACQESMTCTVAAGMVEQIQRQIDAGKSKQEIKDYFAVVYGETVLALPRKSGFSLTAWAIPFLAVGAGALALSAVVWLWVRRRPASPETATLAASPGSLTVYEEQVDQDLRLLE